ncbi:MAG: sigma 54-interacting transcriptional regulator [Proteobacteria bacterium]|nr:sigma 54-interacting transcriptional regulator [Pseudomonadota bacterium]MBU1584966.1 sigma 54-interacting transcriptional regulator [Pseudomonadota bacterium]MBU2453393.1 sigma 54-interacting transcriptional regulator [Pseudomonadota bacterium]MBU2630547.1 sigma 54-interacting transcriptional regulator [Pseudomonadota bacterium]
MNNSTLKLELLFTDRKQIVEDITKIVSANDLNIISMEVENKDKKTLIYIETKSSRFSPSSPIIINYLKQIPDLIEITQINSMPQEIREKRLRVVLDSISDGILSIDKFGFVTTINRVAKKMLGWNHLDVLGKKIWALPVENNDLQNCLKGKSFQNKKRNIITPNGRFQFFSAGVLITDITGEITGAIEIMRNMKEIKELADEVTYPTLHTFSDIIGRSASIMDAISFAQKIAVSSSIVSIRGKSGTGKELFARAIHTESRVKGEFVAVNCAAIPESLLESELFGYEKGSFTGAEKKGKQGLFEIADKGTLFLDEIGDMPLGAQAKILRVIQEKSVRRIGGIKEIPVNTRIITATSRLIEQMIKDNTFREDLYYRINVLPIHVPPLKERYEDIPLLADHFLSRAAKQVGIQPKKLSDTAMKKLISHNWPGNIRELKNVIERGAIISDQDIIDENSIIFGHDIESTIRGLRAAPFNDLENNSLKAMTGGYEKEIIESTLHKHPSIRKSAKALKISHTTILNKMKKYGIGTN